jgi:hypothetical protein
MSDVLATVRSVTGDQPATVQCETGVGDLVAHWRSDVPPQVGVAQHVELDAAGALEWADGPRIVDPDSASERDQVLTGLVEDIEGDAVTVRIGSRVVLLEVQGDPPIGTVGRPVAVRPSAFQLWPIDL